MPEHETKPNLLSTRYFQIALHHPRLVFTVILQIALHHPRLIFSFISGGVGEVNKKHVQIHIDGLAQKQILNGEVSTIDFISNAIERSSKSCFNFEFEYLYFVCQKLQAKKVVETGVRAGFSSTFILKAMENTGGILYSIDLPNAKYKLDDGNIHFDSLPNGLEPGYVIPEHLKTHWKLILGDSRRELPRLFKELGEIDVFHHDSAHVYELMMFEYETAWQQLRPGGLLLSHDVSWNSAFQDFCNKYGATYRIYKGKYEDIGLAIK